MIRYFSICFLLIIISNSCSGQEDLLVLRRKNNNTYYHAGDKISFQIEGSESKITGRILDLKDSVIVFEGFEVPLSKITWLYMNSRRLIPRLLLTAGAGYLCVDLVNGGKQIQRALISSGTMIGLGLIAKLLIRKKIKIKERTRFIILNYNKP
jgi:hypothetical protein